MPTKYHEHLITGLPNFKLTHMAIRFINRRMTASGSKYYLLRRYRLPAPQAKGRRWSLRRNEARRISLYIRIKPAALRVFRLEVERKQMEFNQRLRAAHDNLSNFKN